MKTAIWVNGKKGVLADQAAAILAAKFLRDQGWQVVEALDINTIVIFSPDYAN